MAHGGGHHTKVNCAGMDITTITRSYGWRQNMAGGNDAIDVSGSQ